MRRTLLPVALAALVLVQAEAQTLPGTPSPVPQATAAPAADPGAATVVTPLQPLPPPRYPSPAIAARADSDVLHGVTVADPYRWLEGKDSPEVQAVLKAQAEFTRGVLERLPGRRQLLERINELSQSTATITDVKMAAGRVFYLKLAPGDRTPKLMTRDGVAGPERALLDPQRAGEGKLDFAINWYQPAPDGRHVAYGLSAGGSEDATLYVAETASGRDLGVRLPRTRFNSRLAWSQDGVAFYYATYPDGVVEATRRYDDIRVYRHVLGRAAREDELVFGRGVRGALGLPVQVYPRLLIPVESKYAYAIATEGVKREVHVYQALVRDLGEGKPQWHRIAEPADGITQFEAWGDDLYALTHKGAPRFRVLHASAGNPQFASARVIVPEDHGVWRSFVVAQDGLYLAEMLGGLDRLWRVSFSRWRLGEKKTEFLKLPFDVVISQMVADPRRPGVILHLQSWAEAPSIVSLDARTGNLANLGWQPKSPIDFSEIDEVRLKATSFDGTEIPVSLVYRKSTLLSGDNPTLLTGYGSYGIAVTPTFDATRLAWLERGGILAFAHIRGGGEFGEPWHKGGQKENKVNTIRDFIASAEFLIRYGFTSPKRLAIQGGSAGGIPMGGALTQRPDLFAAAIGRVPVTDMVRLETSPNGPPNIPEFGSTATQEGFLALLAMSPYHHVKEGTAYPGVLLTTGINDPRVEPWQPAKFAARLQAASTSGKPVLLRVDYAAGHGPGSSRQSRDEELADIYAFLFWQFGREEFQPK
jgi:prolyl oligopeptidase